jgi:hypothetical protein
MSVLDDSWVTGLKSLGDYQKSVKYMSTLIQTLWQACTVTSSKDSQIEAYSIEQRILDTNAG